MLLEDINENNSRDNIFGGGLTGNISLNNNNLKNNNNDNIKNNTD